MPSDTAGVVNDDSGTESKVRPARKIFHDKSTRIVRNFNSIHETSTSFSMIYMARAETITYKSNNPKLEVTALLQDVFKGLGIDIGAMLKDVTTKHAKAIADNDELSACPSIREAYQPYIAELDQLLAMEKEAIDELKTKLEQVGGYAGKMRCTGTLFPLTSPSPASAANYDDSDMDIEAHGVQMSVTSSFATAS